MFANDATCWCGGVTNPCHFYARVYATDEVTIGSVEAVGLLGVNTLVTLLDGVPQVGSVRQGAYSQYQFLLSPPLDPNVPSNLVRVTLDSSVGDADLYITIDGSQPTANNFAFRSVRATGAELVEIDLTAPAIAPICNVNNGCVVRIAAQGFARTSNYLVTASLAAYTYLVPGIGQVSTVNAPPAVTYFRLDNFAPTTTVRFALAPLSGAPLMAGGNQNFTRPSPLVPASHVWGPVADVFTLSQPTTPPTTTFFVGVSAAPGATEGAEFSITASYDAGPGNRTYPLLQLGLPVVGRVGGDQYVLFEMLWPDDLTSTVYFALDGRSGYPLPYIRINNPAVTWQNADYAPVGPTALFSNLQVSSSDPDFLAACGPVVGGCTLYIAVYGNTGGAVQSNYVLTAYVQGRQLLDG